MFAALLLAFLQEIPSTRWQQPVHAPPSVHSFEREGKSWFSVRANNSSVGSLLAELGPESHHLSDVPLEDAGFDHHVDPVPPPPVRHSVSHGHGGAAAGWLAIVVLFLLSGWRRRAARA